MIIRFSNVSPAFSYQNLDGGCVLSWLTPLSFCGSSKMSLISISMANFRAISNTKLVHFSTNICQGSVTNPDGYIYTCTTRMKAPFFQKGKSKNST